VIAQSLDAVTDADAIVVVPGPEPSWMANELGHAVGSEKPIALIKHLADQRLSDSLYRGYPVFTWDKLSGGRLVPLRRSSRFQPRVEAISGRSSTEASLASANGCSQDSLFGTC
jgi:hypothetical protein